MFYPFSDDYFQQGFVARPGTNDINENNGMYKGLVCIRFLRIHHLKNLARYVFVF